MVPPGSKKTEMYMKKKKKKLKDGLVRLSLQLKFWLDEYLYRFAKLAFLA